MEEMVTKLKGIIHGLTDVLIAAIGLLVIVQVVFGTGLDVVGGIMQLVDTFVGSGASLASLITLIIVLGIFSRR